MKKLILSREDRDRLPDIVIAMMDFVLVESPGRWFIEKNRNGRVGEVTYTEAIEVLEEIQI